MNQFQIDFTKGYICAVANLVSMYGESTQATGLLDNNGNEIYEGDILKDQKYSMVNGVGEFTDQFPDLVIVIYNEDSPGFALNFFDPNLRHVNRSGHTLCKTNQRIFEIIGNIFENHELITN